MSPKTSAPAALPISVEIDREQIDVTTVGGERTPDQTWRHTDSNGHLHAWDGDKTPSLEWFITVTEAVRDEYEMTEYEVGEYRCLICGEVIEPRMSVDHSRKFVPGPATYRVTIGEEQFDLREEEYAASVDAWLDELRKIRA